MKKKNFIGRQEDLTFVITIQDGRAISNGDSGWTLKRHDQLKQRVTSLFTTSFLRYDVVQNVNKKVVTTGRTAQLSYSF